MDIIMPTCDKYRNVTEITIAAINHCWPNRPKIYIVGYQEPTYKLPENVEFISVGVDNTKVNWSGGLRKFMTEYNKKYFYMWMDDHIPLKNVEHDDINVLLKIMDNHDEIGKIMTHPQLIYSHDIFLYGKNDQIKLYSYSGKFGLSLINSIWNTEYFLSNLKDRLSPWKFEQLSPSLSKKILTVDTNVDIVVSLLRNGVLNKKWANKHHRGVTPEKNYVDYINNMLTERGYA